MDEAIRRHGGRPGDWIDLSTGINRRPYPLPPLSRGTWTALPTRADMASLSKSAAMAYGTAASVLPVAGAQAVIQMIPRLTAPGHARVLGPTYNEHAAALCAAGWTVEEVSSPVALAGADLAVIVNPNNPDGRTLTPDALLSLSSAVGRLVVDESFADPYPECSVARQAGTNGMIVLRSFGKFYGLAGIRLGFVLGAPGDIERLAAMAGPWPVSGAAIEIGRRALRDRRWAADTVQRLHDDADRMDSMAATTGWTLVGGTLLFRLYATPDAVRAQDDLAKAAIWSRAFPYSHTWLRLGLPGDETEWERLARALRG